jgi:hypothetical protein
VRGLASANMNQYTVCLLDLNFNYIQLTLVGGICSCLKSYNLNY